MKRIVICAVMAILMGNLFAQQTKLLTAEKHNEYGLIYTLPITSFQIELILCKETKVAGPFSKYAKIFTSESNVISENSKNWILESVKMKPTGIPDHQNQYLMQLKAGSPTFIGVADDNMLLSINIEPRNESQTDNFNPSIEGEKSTGKEYLDFVNEDFVAAISTFKQAQLLAEEIMEVRDAKLSLTRGTAETMPTDGRQLEIMLSSLEKQEKALMNAFTGNSWKEREQRVITFTPEKSGRYVLCRINQEEGIVDANDLSGEPVYINVSVVENGELPVDAKGEVKKVPKDAVMYCVPGIAEISVNYKGSAIFQKDFPMSQFGVNFGLNPSIFTDKKEPSYAIFDSSTGALKELGTLKP